MLTAVAGETAAGSSMPEIPAAVAADQPPRWLRTARVREAAKFTGIERLGVSTQCGFSSTLPGANLTTEDVQEGNSNSWPGSPLRSGDRSDQSLIAAMASTLGNS
ncbi:MAG: hypothetical protein J2P28_21600 [Actinobacteria bacterium]|nr:hypothetical protein [Actinomycetota bacterium]